MDNTKPGPIEIPPHALSQQALRGIVEAFVLREGTEYGEQEYTLEQKVAQVYRQLERNELVIVFDPEEESCELRIR